MALIATQHFGLAAGARDLLNVCVAAGMPPCVLGNNLGARSQRSMVHVHVSALSSAASSCRTCSICSLTLSVARARCRPESRGGSSQSVVSHAMSLCVSCSRRSVIDSVRGVLVGRPGRSGRLKVLGWLEALLLAGDRSWLTAQQRVIPTEGLRGPLRCGHRERPVGIAARFGGLLRGPLADPDELVGLRREPLKLAAQCLLQQPQGALCA